MLDWENMTTDARIREAIRQAMSEQGMTQQAVADRLGVKQPSVGAVVSGRRGVIPKSLIDILDVLSLELYVRPKN